MSSDSEPSPYFSLLSRPLEGGQVVDGFLLRERLHQGGMANLWRVTHPDHTVPMLMKVPRIKGGDDPATIVGFEVEQMILPTLRGTHVPRFVTKGDFTTQPYIVMEHLPGESLRPRLDHAPVAIEEVIDTAARVATALQDLHRQHVTHLDIKPSNIMFRPSGEVVLIDFGLSRHDHLPDLLDEEFNLPIGTGPYMSPEQVRYVRDEPRSDLFALGVIMYHLVTGQRPFGAPTTVHGLRERLYTEPVPPRVWRAECPPWLQEIILRCLEVDPNRRHDTAALLAFDLMHPAQVPLTARADKKAKAGRLKTLKRWLGASGTDPRSTKRRIAHAGMPQAIVMAAINITDDPASLQDALRETVGRFLQTQANARLACVTVLKTNLIGMDELTDPQGNSLHAKRLAELKHWARPLVQQLKLDDPMRGGRITFQVLEASDPADALIEYAKKIDVDHIIIGAHGSSVFHRLLGSVASQVVSDSNCTVTVVREMAGRSETPPPP